MPTLDIIGYLWTKRQQYDLDGLPEVLQLIADLTTMGLDTVTVEEYKVLGMPHGVTSHLIRQTPEEWEKKVQAVMADSMVSHAIDMIFESNYDGFSDQDYGDR